METWLKENIPYHRALSYPGSEFCCLGTRSRGNKGLLTNRGCKTDWRRKPYTYTANNSQGSKSEPFSVSEDWLRKAESVWCEKSVRRLGIEAGETVVYARLDDGKVMSHSIAEVPVVIFDGDPSKKQKVVRPWHVRVSQYFVLMDFCRNEKMFECGIVTVPPLTLQTANTVVKVARMFGEVLDPVKMCMGNISVVRGMEPKGYAKDERKRYHRWVPALARTHSVEFVTPVGSNRKCLNLLKANSHVKDVKACKDPVVGGDRVRVTIESFTPRKYFTSAKHEEYPWSE